MGFKIEWGDEEHRYIYIYCPPNWTWQAFDENRPIVEDMLQQATCRVDIICDFSDCSGIPPNLLANLNRYLETRLSNDGYIVVFGAGTIIQAMYDIALRIFPHIETSFFMVKSIDDALQIIGRDRDRQASS